MQLAQQPPKFQLGSENPAGQAVELDVGPMGGGVPQLPPGNGGYASEGTYAPPGGNVGGGAMGGDGWTMSSPLDNGSQPISGYAELVEIRGRAGPGQMVLIFFTVLFLAAGGYFAYEYFVNDRNPFAGIASWFSDDLPELPASNRVPKLKPMVAAAPPAPEFKALEIPEKYGPYVYLPNPLVSERMDNSRTWTAAEEEVWRGGLSHRFNYQRYKTVLDVVAMKLSGSEAILWNALEEKKLWTRMRAAMGLADMGIVISTSVVEKAIGRARPEAVEGYFKRFVQNASSGERYVMREALKVAAPIARIVILEALTKWDDSYRNVYFAAAAYDKSPVVKKYLDSASMIRGIPKSAIDEFERLARSGPPAVEGDAGNSTPVETKTKDGEQLSEAPQAPVDGPEAMEKADGWDAYASDSGFEDEETSQVGFYNTQIMQEEAGPKNKAGKTGTASGQSPKSAPKSTPKAK